MHIKLPPDLPPPKYQLNQEVKWSNDFGGSDCGTIRGIQYFTPAMSAGLCSNLDWVGWSYIIECNLKGSKVTDIQDVHEQDLELHEAKPSAKCTCLSNSKKFPVSREARIQAELGNIHQTLHEPLEPTEYCQRWVQHPLHLQGYQKACDRALAHACGLIPFDVQSWGREWRKRPNYVPYLLRLADIVKRSQSMGICISKLKQPTPVLNIPLPDGVPHPRFHFWQQVNISDEWGDRGTVIGMKYQSEWWYAIELDESLPHKHIEPVRHVPEKDIYLFCRS